MGRGTVTEQDDAALFSEVLERSDRHGRRPRSPTRCSGASLRSPTAARTPPATSTSCSVLTRRTGRWTPWPRPGTPSSAPTRRGSTPGGGVLVDLIFRTKGDIPLDDEVLAHATLLESSGRVIRVVSPEDALVIEAAGNQSQEPQRWENALGSAWPGARSIGTDPQRRARFAARRTLSLLDLRAVEPPYRPRAHDPVAVRLGVCAMSEPDAKADDAYLLERARKLLAEDGRVGELELELSILKDTVVVRSRPNDARRQAVGEVLADLCPGYRILNQTRCSGRPQSPRRSGCGDPRRRGGRPPRGRGLGGDAPGHARRRRRPGRRPAASRRPHSLRHGRGGRGPGRGGARDLPVPVVAVLGNHDHQSDRPAEVADVVRGRRDRRARGHSDGPRPRRHPARGRPG